MKEIEILFIKNKIKEQQDIINNLLLAVVKNKEISNNYLQLLVNEQNNRNEILEKEKQYLIYKNNINDIS